MRRRLIDIAALVSLVGCVGLGAAIVRSYWVLDQWNRFRHTEFWSVELEQGQLFWVHGQGDLDHGAYDVGRSGTVTLRHWRVSLWWIAGLAAVLPAVWVIRREAWRRWIGKRPAGVCRYCGYDLRASPDRCPECGMVCVAILEGGE